MQNFEDDVPKYYKRKRSNVSKSREKSDHKHIYKECLLMSDGKPYRASYCKICGKINDLKFGECERYSSGYYRMMSEREVFEKYKDLDRFYVDDIWQKYIPLVRD